MFFFVLMYVKILIVSYEIPSPHFFFVQINFLLASSPVWSDRQTTSQPVVDNLMAWNRDGSRIRTKRGAKGSELSLGNVLLYLDQCRGA